MCKHLLLFGFVAFLTLLTPLLGFSVVAGRNPPENQYFEGPSLNQNPIHLGKSHLSQEHLKGKMGQEAITLEDTPVEIISSDKVESLLEAARYDDMEDIMSLVSDGVSLDSKDSQGRTALHMASANGHLNIVQYLIGRGVDLNASNAEMNTPLHWACLNGHVEVVKKLILAGANVGVLNCYEKSPIDEALSGQKMDVIDAVNEALAQVELTGVRVSQV